MYFVFRLTVSDFTVAVNVYDVTLFVNMNIVIISVNKKRRNK